MSNNRTSRHAIILCGHSHVNALHDAMVGEDCPVGLADEVTFFGGVPDDDYWSNVAASAADCDIVLCWNGNEHNAAFLLQPSPDFTIFSECCDWTGRERPRLLPESQVKASFAWSSNAMDAFVQRLFVAGARRVFLLAAPPPLPDGTLLRERLCRSSHFIHKAEMLGFDLRAVLITRASLRVALWRLVNELRMECARRRGATFVAAPSGSQDADRCLKPVLSVGDATHANRAYGLLAWSDILALLGTS